MDWLGSWLKSIILVILLATFVDILLPSHTMQRYVKSVMSLFILLTLLQPLFSLFQKQSSLDQSMANAETLFDGKINRPVLEAFSPLPGEQENMQSLDGIQERAKQLKLQHEQQSERLMQQQISDLMKRDIEQSADVKVLALQVETGKDAAGQMQIRSVHVQADTVSKPVASKDNSNTVKPVTVESVKPVNISVDSVSEPVLSSKRSAESTTTDRDPADPAVALQQTQIKMLLNKQWQVPLERLRVDIAGKKL